MSRFDQWVVREFFRLVHDGVILWSSNSTRHHFSRWRAPGLARLVDANVVSESLAGLGCWELPLEELGVGLFCTALSSLHGWPRLWDALLCSC